AIRDIYVMGDVQKPNPAVPGHGAVLAVSLFLSRLLFAGDDIAAVPLYFAELKQEAGLPDVEYAKSCANFANQRFMTRGSIVCDRLLYIIDTLRVERARISAARSLSYLALQISSLDLLPAIVRDGADKAVPPDTRPLDPFDGQPLKIAVRDGGVVVYSVWF